MTHKSNESSRKVHQTPCVPPTSESPKPDDAEVSTSGEYSLFQVQDEGRRPIVVTIEVEKRDIEMEVDTGAAVSLMSSSRYHSLYPDLPLQKSKLILTTYTGEQLKLVGERQVEVNYGSQRKHLKGKGHAFCGI